MAETSKYARQVIAARAQVEAARLAVTQIEAPERLADAIELETALRHLAAARTALFRAGGTVAAPASEGER